MPVRGAGWVRRGRWISARCRSSASRTTRPTPSDATASTSAAVPGPARPAGVGAVGPDTRHPFAIRGLAGLGLRTGRSRSTPPRSWSTGWTSPTASSASGGRGYERHAYRNVNFYHTGWPSMPRAGRAAERRFVFPAPLDPVDDRPPFTVVTRVEPVGRGRLLVRGVSVDDGAVRSVRVNGRAARPLVADFSQWEAEVDADRRRAGCRFHRRRGRRCRRQRRAGPASDRGPTDSPRPWRRIGPATVEAEMAVVSMPVGVDRSALSARSAVNIRGCGRLRIRTNSVILFRTTDPGRSRGPGGPTPPIRFRGRSVAPPSSRLFHSQDDRSPPIPTSRGRVRRLYEEAFSMQRLDRNVAMDRQSDRRLAGDARPGGRAPIPGPCRLVVRLRQERPAHGLGRRTVAAPPGDPVVNARRSRCRSTSAASSSAPTTARPLITAQQHRARPGQDPGAPAASR